MIRKRLMTEINLASLKLKDNFQSNFYSEDFQGILRSTLEQKYGGPYISHMAAKIIQHAYRQFRMKQKLEASSFYETKSVHYRNNSMPDNLHFFQDYDEMLSSNEYVNKNLSSAHSAVGNLKSSKIKDSLSLLLPELQSSSMTRPSLSESSNTETDNPTQDQVLFDNCQFKIGDSLSTKCEEDLEKFHNDSFKTDSTEESDSSSADIASLSCQDPANIVRLPPPMPVITTSILCTKPDPLKTKIKLFSFDKSSVTNADSVNRDCDNNALKPTIAPRAAVNAIGGIQSTRSPRDSGVSSHSSNTDLLTFEYPGGQIADNYGRGHIINCSLQQRPQSAISTGTAKSITIANHSQAQKEIHLQHDSTSDSYIPPITEDTDSLFDSPAPQIPSVMTSSKDSGVDADSGSGLSNQPGHLRRLSFHDKPIYWKLFHRHSCFTRCVTQPIDGSSSQKENHARTAQSSPWLKHNITDELEPATSATMSESEYKELVNRVLYRVAVNLFNRNTTVGLKFMEDHHIFNVKCPIEIANFLRSREVNLQVLADFISSRNSVFHLQVLRCFLQNLSLQNLSFLEAFNMFISTFKLPDDSNRINFLIAQFCHYYTRHVQKCAGVEIGALMGLSRVIVLLRSSVNRSRSTSSSNNVLSFSDFVKNVQNCFKGQSVPYNMEMLQKIYISITRSNTGSSDVAETLINRIGNIDECNSKSGTTSKVGKTNMCNGYLQQSYRRLTYCCDVQQADTVGRKLKKNEHLRSIFVFNDTIIVAKRLSKIPSKQSKLFRTDSRFQCRAIINLLNYRVTKMTSPGSLHQINISHHGPLSKLDTASSNSYSFLCDSDSSRDKLLSKIHMSQLESQCVEKLRIQQWNCIHDNNSCLCLSIINPRLRTADIQL